MALFRKIILIGSAAISSVSANCDVVTFDTTPGATYDLSDLHGDYRIIDSDPEVAYEYIFSVCRDVDATYLGTQTSACVG
jgi:hypothetical protein